MMTLSHQPVMLAETLRGLAPRPGGVYIDATVGFGGHAAAILKKIAGPGTLPGSLLGIDKDEKALIETTSFLAWGEPAKGSPRVFLRKGDFKDIKKIAEEVGIEKADGILFDLGVSSRQLDDPDRGFSYSRKTRLDMRMDEESELTAADVLNGYDEERLAELIREYGEEKWAKRIAGFIVKARPIKDSEQLLLVIESAVPRAAREKKYSNAKRVFQAIRIEVNDELGALREGLSGAMELLGKGSRLVVISFHSLEDRIVKKFIAERENPCVCPPELPECVCGKLPTLKRVGRGVIRPSEEEVEKNRRAKPAKLRIAEKL
jgi:16S rRNA (cytosine1402-N4)-methyltransferase